MNTSHKQNATTMVGFNKLGWRKVVLKTGKKLITRPNPGKTQNNNDSQTRAFKKEDKARSIRSYIMEKKCF